MLKGDGQEYVRTKTWFDSHDLDLAMHKMKLLLFTGRYIPLQVGMSIGNGVYLGNLSENKAGSQTNIFVSDG